MTADWDETFGENNDPFGIAGDVFGSNIGDVDPFQGNDSFDGVAEWDAFNGDGDDDDGFCGPDEEESVQGSVRSSSSRPRGSSSQSGSSPRRKGRRPEKSRSSTSKGKSSRSPTRASSSSKSHRHRHSHRRSGDDREGHAEDEAAERRRRRPPRPSAGPRSASCEDLKEKPNRQFSRRQSMPDGASSHSTSSSSSRFRHTRQRDGTMTRSYPSDQASKIQKSDERRNAIKDSLFDALGDEDLDNGPSLSGFLNKNSEPRRKGRSGGSVQSAPAVATSRQHSRHRRGSVGGGMEKPSHKSHRYKQKMSGQSSPKADKLQIDKLDIASLAEQGYLEVQDGKMRLVIDVDADKLK